MAFSFRRWVARALFGNGVTCRKRNTANSSMSSVAALTTIALSADLLEERTLMAADIGIDLRPVVVPGETTSALVWYQPTSGQGGGRAGGDFSGYFGQPLLGPTATELDNPSDGVFYGGGFEIIGQDAGKAAGQLYNALGDRGGVAYFDSFLSAGGNSGDRSGGIAGVQLLHNGQKLYVGQSAGLFDVRQPTYWFASSIPQGGVSPQGQQATGNFLDVTRNGVFVGSLNQLAVYGVAGELPQFLPGFDPVAAVDISANGEFIVGSLLWQATGSGYSVYSTANFDFSVSGGTPTWRGVEVDGTGEVFFAGEYFDLNTFATSVGYWNGDGDFLGSLGVSFADFDVVGGEVVAAVNGFDDGALVRVRDGAFVSIADLTGSAAMFPAKGLFTTDGALGLLLQDGDGMFVTVLDTIGNPTGNGDPDKADLFIDFNSDGVIDQILRGVNGEQEVNTSFLRAGTYTATIIAKDSAGVELGRSTDQITVSAYRVENGVLIIGADQTRGSSINVTQQRNGSLRVAVDSTRGTVTDAFFVEVIGSPRADRVVLNGSFVADANLGAGNDSLTVLGVDVEGNLGDGNDTALAIGSGEVRFIGGAGNDALRSIGHALAFFDGGIGNDSILSSGRAAFAIGGDGRDSFTILDRHSVVVSDIVRTSTTEQYYGLVDSVFAELGKPNPNRNTVTSLFSGLITDDDDADTGLVLSRWSVKLLGRKDKVR